MPFVIILSLCSIFVCLSICLSVLLSNHWAACSQTTPETLSMRLYNPGEIDQYETIQVQRLPSYYLGSMLLTDYRNIYCVDRSHRWRGAPTIINILDFVFLRLSNEKQIL